MFGIRNRKTTRIYLVLPQHRHFYKNTATVVFLGANLVLHYL